MNMKKSYLWAIVTVFLLFIVMKCADSSHKEVIENHKKEIAQDSINLAKIKELKQKTKIQDSLDVIKVKELKQYFTEKKDEFSNIKWVEPKTRPRYTNQNGYCMYFSVENGVANNPRFLIQYEADDWLFIQNMIFNIDGENITFTPEKMERDNGNGGRIWEWFDEYAINLESLIRKISYAKSVKIKMVGRQYYDVKTMSSKQIKYFKYSYEYYKALGGTFN